MSRKLTRLAIAAAAVMLPLAASAGTYIIPAVGTGPGAQGSQWKTEVKLHATGLEVVDAKLQFHQDRRFYDGYIVRINASTTVTLDDVVATRFLASGTGAMEIIVPDEKAFRRLSVTSRTYNQLGNGNQLGQDVPALKLDEAATAGTMVIVPGPSNTARKRFNFGIYAVTETRVSWDLLRADGSPVTSKRVTYATGQHVQYNNGIETLLGEDAHDGDSVRAVIETGKAIVYGSEIDQSGDPTYIPGMQTREQFDLIFVGVDLDEDGKVDVLDLNGDGVLDQPLDVVTSLFPTTVRVVVRTEFGAEVRSSGLSVVSSTSDAEFIDANGTLTIGATGDLKNTTGEIRLRGRSESSVEEFVIPVRFR